MGQYPCRRVNSKDFLPSGVAIVVGALSLLVFLLVDLVDMFLIRGASPACGWRGMTNMLAGEAESADRRRARSSAAGLRTPENDQGRPGIETDTVAILVIVAVIGPLVPPYASTKIAGSPHVPPGSQLVQHRPSGLDVFSRTWSRRDERLHRRGLHTAGRMVGILIGLLIEMNESGRGPIGLLARSVARALDLLQALPAMIVGLSWSRSTAPRRRR